MYITKSEPIVTKNGFAKENVKIVDNILYIDRPDGNLKYENDKWYVYGEDNIWYFIGYGANPSYKVDNANIIDQEIFNNIFEEENC